ncbi:MAG: alpha-N-acetylglucosaminidase [Clostridia bacterium]|nr:alpha-N-acetylglucosaminidase [Clostridia bacterium]
MTAIYQLIERVLPGKSGQIICRLCEADQGRDTYSVGFEDGKLLLCGNNQGSLAAALGYYLKNTLKADLSWCGCNLVIPETLPQPVPYRHCIEQKYRVYMNYCTFNYSAAWWDFDRWEKEIDFMALNGINMPLCIVGVEGIWYHTLISKGFSEEETLEFLSGPAFLAWQWMANLDGFAGPLPKSWVEKSIVLGKKIIDRVTSLGMMPIQQGFSGHVPKSFAEKYPEAKLQYKGEWCGLDPTVQLDPTDPLFYEFGMEFLQQQKKLFGAYGYYASDPFHESAPPVAGDEYLNSVGIGISEMFRQFDADYKWVMQAWSIRKGIASVVPKDRLLVLDLNGFKYKNCEAYWGYDFVLGNLHNFGGRIRMHGDLRAQAENRYAAAKEIAPNAVGTGLFMEGIGQNPVYYALAFEMLTRTEPVDLDAWLDDYILRRYGTYDKNARQAWDILLRTVYARNTDGVETSSAVCARPALNLKKSGPNDGFSFAYDIEELKRAASLLLDTDSETDGYLYDITDITRQYLSDYAYFLYKDTAKAFYDRDAQKFDLLSGQFLQMLDDMDRLLYGREEFRFDKWVSDAVRHGETEAEKALYGYNAAALVTIWGKDDNPHIFDYSWREWSGLIGQYYKMRWSFFFDKMKDILEKDEEYSEDGLPLVYGRETWRANALYNEMADLEVEWIHSEKTFLPYEQADQKTTVRELLEQYDSRV